MKVLLLLSCVLLATAGCSTRDDDRHSAPRNEPRDSNSRAPSDTSRVQDPVCGMVCDRNSARTYDYNSKVYYFCSEECRDKFKGAPESYTVRR